MSSCSKHHQESNIWGRSYGRGFFDVVPIFLLLVLAVISEVRDIASHMFSSWTKVALMCRLLKQTTSQHSLPKNKWIGLLLRRRCKLMRYWDEKMGQCLVLGLQPGTTPLVFLWRLLRLPDQKTKVKVPEAVKVSIIHELRRSKNGCLSDGTSSLRRSQAGDNLLWACNNKDTSDTILTWHIATSILEVRYPNRHDQEHVSPLTCNSDDKIVATHLSRYCAYLVTWYPELLPDNDAWSKSLYEDITREVEPALTSHIASAAMSTPLAEYEQLVDHLLCANTKHEVLKNGARLGKELAELIEDEETAWKLLASFWSEMILYVAPSDNLKGHSEAIARGGELITLLWALLTHAGIVCRPGEDRCPDAAGATTTV
ncbi:uncharacterized protein LOC101782748 isoform X1 [Setaria italica]|uniref:DUF4220 domain-containing protein n=2 Tax=Setaria italica TaxID=4555 RepID=K3ZUE0_SETIT|nr:uncharacterized protein LOC101782748 isoform X1 [Setaria italica]